jgi:2'-5' RNA ligase
MCSSAPLLRNAVDAPQDVKKGEFAIAYTEFTLWLIPNEPLASTLQALIRRLATDFDAVAFEPHVTLFCGPSNEDEAQATAGAMAARFPPVELSVERLDYTDSFTKTLFVQFAESAAARRMSEAARDCYSSASNYAFNPHLSLIYTRLPEGKQRELCRTLSVPRGTYTFDRVRMVETELPIEDAGPVRRWKTIGDFPLAGR